MTTWKRLVYEKLNETEVYKVAERITSQKAREAARTLGFDIPVVIGPKNAYTIRETDGKFEVVHVYRFEVPVLGSEDKVPVVGAVAVSFGYRDVLKALRELVFTAECKGVKLFGESKCTS